MKIYRNGVEIYEIKDFKVTGRFMEVAILDCAIKSPIPIAFKIGDYVTYDYNNLTYSLYDIPVPKKQARSGSYGEAFIYNLKFKSNMEHLVICPFLDLVANDNTLHYTSLPSFSTFENVYGIAARIQANMDYLYPGKWRIVVGETSDSELLETLNEAKEFAISGQSCFEGLRKIYDIWGVGYIYSEANGINTITIGKSAGTTSVFRYGKGQGLRTIGKNIQNNDQFCTRAYVFGSTRNLPARWYNEKGYIGEAQYAPNLMIPFSKWVGGIPQGAYIDAIFGGENRVEKYGLRIKTFSYDGSGNNEEIYPSIEKVTAGNIRSAKAELGETKHIPSSRYSNSERMDYILEGSSILDDGVSAEAGYELYSEKLTASVGEIKESIIIAEPLKEEKYKLLSFQKNIVICSFDITKSAIYQISEIAEMFSFSKNDLESTISAKWYMQTPDGSFIDLKKSLSFTDKLQASLQLPQVTFEAKETGKYTLVLRLSVGWSVEYVVPQIDGDIFLTYAVNSDSVEIARGTRILSSTFILKLKQIGFDLNSVTASDGSKKTITMKDGMCGGRSFVIRQCKYSASDDSWELVCSRVNDSSISQTFPNSIFPISAGDQFILLNINMPDLYVHTAMQRLYDTALADLKHYSLPQFVVSPEIDNLQMVRSPQILREGMYMPIEDSDIDIDEDILIDSVTITEKGTELRSFSVTLRNDKIYNRFSKIATSISNLESSIEEAKKNAVNTPVADDSTTEVLVDSNNVATEDYFELTPEDEVKTKDDRPLIGKEARFSNLALPASAPTEPKEGEVYGYISDRSNSAVDLTPLFKRINVGTEDNPQWAVIPVDYNGNPVGIVSDTFITAGGRNGNSSDQGTATTLGGLVNVDDTADDLQTEDMVLVKSVDATHWTLRALSTLGLNKTELESYLTTNSYLKKDTADGLYAPLASFNTLNTKVNDFLTGTDTDSIINKWKELEAFLAGQTETSTLADLLAVKADKAALEALTTRVTTAEGNITTNQNSIAANLASINTLKGYFTNGSANNALKLGGHLPEYFATAEALSKTNQQLATQIENFNYFVGTTYKAHLNEYSTFKTDTQRRLNALEALWAIDEDNNGLYPKSGRGIWSESYITAGGIGTSAGAGGLIQTVYGYNSLGGTFDNTVLTDTFNAYAINYIYTEVEKLKSGDTGFSESAMWTALGGSAENKVIASEHIPDLSGKYLPLSGGTMSGRLYIDSSSNADTPLTLISNKTDINGACRIQFLDSNRVFQAYVMTGWGNLILSHRSYNQLGIGGSGIWCSSDNGATKYTLIHSGNIGSQSVDSAKKLAFNEGGWIWSNERGIHLHPTSNTEQGIAINYLQNGNVLIGTTTDSGYKLYVAGTLNTTTIYQNGQTLDKYYLPLSGGTLTSSQAVVLSLDTTYYLQNAFLLLHKGVNKTQLGYVDGAGSYIYDYTTGKYLGIDTNGAAYCGTSNNVSSNNHHLLIHSGNIGSQSVDSAKKLAFNEGGWIWSNERGIHLHPTSNTEQGIAINYLQNGNVLIGTTTDSGYKLYVNGTLSAGATTVASLTSNGAISGTSLSISGGITGYFNTKLSWSGRETGSYDGSADASFVIPSLVSQLSNDMDYATRTQARGYVANLQADLEDGTIAVGYANEAGTASNLMDAPAIGAYGNNIYIVVGDKESDAFVVPYATNAGTATNLANKPSFSIYNETQIKVTVGGQTSNAFTVPYADSAYYADSAASAARLSGTGAYTLWGKTFWSNGKPSGNISGTLSSVGDILFGNNSNNYRIYKSDEDTLNVYGYSNLTLTASSNGLSATGYRGISLYSGAGSITIEAYNNVNILSNTEVSGNIYATGAITAGSDARYKSKLQDVAVDVEVIADAPLFDFVWNDGRKDTKTYLGTTAQYWAQTNFKNAVIPTDNEKLWTMSYSQIAMGNTIVLARELLPIKRKVREIDDLKSRLHKAEKKIEILEKELKQYRRA